jgi:hypothetical protein
VPLGCVSPVEVFTMPSRPQSADSTFGHDINEAMFKALTETCGALQANDRSDREVIAARILDLALSGVKDSATLRTRVLRDARSVTRTGSTLSSVKKQTARR